MRDQTVDLQMRSGAEDLFTHGAVQISADVPVFSDAFFAEVVSTRCGNWISEDA